jgi:Tol biopolymer transport system component
LNQQFDSTGIARLMIKIKQHRLAASLAMTFAVLALAGISFGLSRIFPGARVPFQSGVMTRLTNYGDAWNPAISSDGKWIVYVKGEGLDKPSPKHTVCIRKVGEATETEIVAPTEGQFGAVGFLPDGKSIYYRLQLPNQPVTTTVVPLSGGTATKLSLTTFGMSYSADGQHIAYIDNNLPEGKTSLILANGDGTNERKIVTRQAPSYFWAGVAPAWAPDGKTVACVGQSEGFPRVIEIDLQAGSERPITSQRWFDIRAVAWLPDGNGLLIAAAEETSPMMQIWHISYPNGEARRITSGTMNSFALSVSADGTALATDTTSAPTSIWVLPVTAQPSGSFPFVDANSGKQINVTNFIGFTNFRYMRLSWAAEARILFVSQESGNADIWSMNADGSDRRQLTTDPHSDTWPVVSPDGRSIVFMSDRAGADNIWRMDIDGKNQTRLTSERRERYPVFTADGKFIFFNSSISGKETIWKMPVAAGQATQVLSDYSYVAVVSPDGKLLAYYSPEKIVVVPIDGGPPIKTFDGKNNTKLAWSPDGRALTYLVNREFVPNLWMQPLDGGPAKQLTNFTSQGISSYAWSSDGKQLAVARTSFKSDIVLISDAR